MDGTMSNPIHVSEGDDLDITNRKFLPYEHIETLGVGGYASVEMVRDTTNGRVFAHKRFRRYHGPYIDKFKKEFQNEVKIIRRLHPHPHIIRVFATYVCGREVGMILTPVADCGDLATYLQTIADSGKPPTTEQCTILERAFGCLASGLAFIHEQTIRHKDIKPQNILIHQGLVIYTDFGIALDASEYDNTTTTGTAYAFTYRYCAPEVATSARRNRKSDVFSLGCVFTEILAILDPRIRLENVEASAYHKNIDGIRATLNRCKTTRSDLIRVSIDMLETEPNYRISTKEIVNKLMLLEKSEFNPKCRYFCDCCAPKPLEKGPLEEWSGKSSLFNTLEAPVEAWSGKNLLLNTLEGHSRAVNSVAFSPGSKLLASGSDDKTIKLWDLATGTLRSTFGGDMTVVWTVAFSPDGKLLASGSSDQTIRLWDLATGTLHSTLKGHLYVVWTVAFSPDGKRLASGSKDKTIKLWDSTTGALLDTLEGDMEEIWSVAFSPDGKMLASGSSDWTIRLWDLATRTLHSTLEGHLNRVWTVAFSPDGRQLASGSDDNTIKLWDLATGDLRSTFKGHLKGVWTIAFSPDGKLLASGSHDRTIRLWDSATGTLRGTLEGGMKEVWAVAFSPDGKMLASGSTDPTIRLWGPTL
jgi:WD40 repeat protein/tRNA A-37 threonylcarbamoyl transferase component Bud32